MNPIFPADPSKLAPADILHWLLHVRCDREDVEVLVERAWARPKNDPESFRLAVGHDISMWVGKQASGHQKELALFFLTRFHDRPLYMGGDGKSPTNAVKINTDSGILGVAAEYAYLNLVIGRQGEAWDLVEREHGIDERGIAMECFHIELADRTRMSVWFDLSNFYAVATTARMHPMTRSIVAANCRSNMGRIGAWSKQAPSDDELHAPIKDE